MINTPLIHTKVHFLKAYDQHSFDPYYSPFSEGVVIGTWRMSHDVTLVLNAIDMPELSKIECMGNCLPFNFFGNSYSNFNELTWCKFFLLGNAPRIILI